MGNWLSVLLRRPEPEPRTTPAARIRYEAEVLVDQIRANLDRLEEIVDEAVEPGDNHSP